MRTALLSACVVTTAAFVCGFTAEGAVLHQFTTTDAAAPTNDDGYVADVVTVASIQGVIAPSTGAALPTGAVELSRFWNSEWAGFSLSSANGSLIDDALEFDRGYFTWTVSAQPGNKLNLESLQFGSARGGDSNERGFLIYAEVNGGTFAFDDTPLLSIASELGTRAAPTARTLDLSAPLFQNIDSITFRYYPLTPATGNTVDFSGMTLNGEVIPEPSSAALLALGCAGLLSRRRRRA